MKKIFFVLVVSLLLTGCSKIETITCSKKVNDYERDTKIIIKIKHTKNTIKGLYKTIEYTSKDIANGYCELYKLSYDKEDNNNFSFDCTGKTITWRYKDLEKIEFNESNLKNTKTDDYVKYLEQENYSCK